MIGTNILLATLIIIVAILLGFLIYEAISFFKEEEYLEAILCVVTVIATIGFVTGWTLIGLGI